MKSTLQTQLLLISLLSFGELHASTVVSPRAASVNPADITSELVNHHPVAQQPSPVSIDILNPTKSKLMPSKVGPIFVLKDIHFIHHDPIPAEVIAVYQPYLNKSMSFHELKDLAAQMQAKYRELGFILVQVVVPPQEISKENGIVKLQILEGQIQHVIFVGDAPKGAKAQLECYANAIAKEDPITYKTIDHFLALANGLPGISASATLVPSKEIRAAADLIINLKQKSEFGFLTYNNFGGQYVGPGQMIAGVGANDLFMADSMTFVGGTSTSDQRELMYLSGSYEAIVGPYSTTINPVISHTVTHPGSGLADLDMTGTSDKYALNITQPIAVSTIQKFNFISSLYHLTSTNEIPESVLYQDIITAITAGVSFKGLFWNSYNDLDLYTTIGLPILGAPSSLNNPSRVNGKTQFLMFDYDSNTIRYLTQKLSLAFTSSGQITNDPLLTTQQIGFGGQLYGQGFTPYVISGDNGLIGSLAVRYDLPTYGYVDTLQPQVFYSAGVVSNNQALPGTYNRAWGSSVGVGLNISAFHSIQMSASLAKPLNLTENISNKSWQAFFNIVGMF